MSEKKRSLMAIFVALMIIIVGLFLVCSQRATINQGQDLATDDEAFRRELLEMLDLADDTGTNDGTLAEFQSEESQRSETADDVLSLLVPESGESQAVTNIVAESTPTTTNETMGLTPKMFTAVQKDVSRLETILETQSQAVDSLKRIVENKNARIRELEARISLAPSRPRLRQPVPRGVSATNDASGFMAGYNAARQKFENYNYKGAIESFSRLLGQYPNHKLADNCQYWIGESYYGLKQYQKAILEFQKVFSYSQTDKHDDAQLMIGLAYVKQGMKDRANREFTTFLNTYAGSEYTSVAKRYMSNI